MIERVSSSRRKDLGGLEVGRVIPQPQCRMVGPFVFLDHMGPVEFKAGMPKSVDVRPHPHIGLATVSYLFDGEMMHRDSVGSEQAIRPGEVNWMTAGRGITHSERFEAARRQGGSLHGIQTWVALPKELEECDPSFAHHGVADLPTYESGGLWARLVIGDAFGAKSRVATHSPMFCVHWRLTASTQAQLPAEYAERAAYIVAGEVEVEGQRHQGGTMLTFGPGKPVLFTALQDATVILFGGESLGPRFVDWNFVSSSKERIEQAKADWRANRMKLPDRDNQEFIPLPE